MINHLGLFSFEQPGGIGTSPIQKGKCPALRGINISSTFSFLRNDKQKQKQKIRNEYKICVVGLAKTGEHLDRA